MGDEAATEMGPHCDARDKEGDAGKKGAGSPPFTPCPQCAGTGLNALHALLSRSMLILHHEGRQMTPFHREHFIFSDLPKNAQLVPGPPYSRAYVLSHISGQYFRKISLVSARITVRKRAGTRRSYRG